MLPLDPTNTKNNRKDIEWKIRFIFYFHIQKFQTRYSHTTSIPPNSERNVLERRYSEEGAVGSSHPPPPPLLLPFPHLYHGLFFPVHNKQGLWEDVHVLLVRSEIAMQHWYFLPNPPLSLPLPWICLKQGQCLIWWKHQMFNEDLFADYSWESHGYQSSHLWTREAFWPVSSRWTLLALSKCDKTS